MKACMGGWCRKRERCEHYHAEDRSDPAERLCEPGKDGKIAAGPVDMRAALKAYYGADPRFAAWMAGEPE